MGNLLAALAFRLVYVPVHAAHPDYAWRVMFFIGGLPALLSLFIRAKVKESEAWQEHRTDWTTYRRSLWKHWPRFLFIVNTATAWQGVDPAKPCGGRGERTLKTRRKDLSLS